MKVPSDSSASTTLIDPLTLNALDFIELIIPPHITVGSKFAAFNIEYTKDVV